jgi:hypothetical protein
MMPDGSGGMFFGSVDIEMIKEGQATRPATIWRITADGKVTVAADGLGFANGIMLSEDGRELYYNDTFVSPFVFDVDADHRLSNRRRLIEKEDCDGMALDAEGNLWITGFRSSALTRIRGDGTPLDPVETPAGAITQIRFGGADMRDYYLTCVPADGGDGSRMASCRPSSARCSIAGDRMCRACRSRRHASGWGKPRLPKKLGWETRDERNEFATRRHRREAGGHPDRTLRFARICQGRSRKALA